MFRFDKNNLLFGVQSAIFGLLIALLLHYFFFHPKVNPGNEPAAKAPITATSTADSSQQPFSYRGAVARAAPAVVNIFTRSKYRVESAHISPLFDKLFNSEAEGEIGDQVETSVGSGVIVSPEGHIITNHHVIADAAETRVILTDGGSFPAKLIGTDVETDLAVLHIDTTVPLPSITFAAPGDLQVGDVVLAIGNPFGVGQTVTQGIVSATSRNRLGLNTFEEFIQTDAAINPGNSGGALVNPRGELVGINTAIFTNSEGAQGISFAIPISLAQNVMMQILERGEVIRGWLGVQAYDITAAMRKRFQFNGPGVLVTGVFRDSPAAMAGIQAGDILTHIEQEPLYDTQMLLNATKNRPPSTPVEIHGLRNGRDYSLAATLMQRPQSQ